MRELFAAAGPRLGLLGSAAKLPGFNVLFGLMYDFMSKNRCASLGAVPQPLPLCKFATPSPTALQVCHLPRRHQGQQDGGQGVTVHRHTCSLQLQACALVSCHCQACTRVCVQRMRAELLSLRIWWQRCHTVWSHICSSGKVLAMAMPVPKWPSLPALQWADCTLAALRGCLSRPSEDCTKS